jgi:hypothetical protein
MRSGLVGYCLMDQFAGDRGIADHVLNLQC